MNLTSSDLASIQARRKTHATGTGSEQRIAIPKRGKTLAGVVISVWLPLRLVNTLNFREHWAPRAKRAKCHRATVLLRLQGQPLPELPVVVTLTRLYSGRSKPFDDDGMSAACKSIRDGAADAYGTSDSASSGLTFRYEQQRSSENLVNVVIEKGAAK